MGSLHKYAALPLNTRNRDAAAKAQRQPSRPASKTTLYLTLVAVLLLLNCLAIYCAIKMFGKEWIALAFAGAVAASNIPQRVADPNSSATPTVPDYFQTSPEVFAGPTVTGTAPFLAQTNPVFYATGTTFVANGPLETSEPIVGSTNASENIFHLMGNLSPYFQNPTGFGVAEYPLPKGANITQVQMLSRHGSRYPTTNSSVQTFGAAIKNATAGGKFKTTGELEFLNTWSYNLGAEILVPRGRNELFDSGVLHYYNYGRLYNPNSKIIARTTTQDRMLKSAEYFMAGFFGLEWTNNVTLEVIIEQNLFNNSLAGYYGCNNSNSPVSVGGTNASNVWINNYLQNATKRFQDMTEGFTWTPSLVYAAQTLCPYETVAYGYSVFCSLFTYPEWVSFEYALDLAFAGNNAFQSPTGRAVGIGYQQEIIARLENHTLGYSGSQINTTLDNNTSTFPLNQTLYFDFSHDTNIMSILTAFGFRQFAQLLPNDTYPGAHNLTVSHLEPFGARLDIEVIKTPKPLCADRTYEEEGEETTYVHFVLNQRTLPLGFSFPECDAERLDGWCELDTFLKVQKGMTELARYDFACFGEYEAKGWGEVSDGAPVGGG